MTRCITVPHARRLLFWYASDGLRATGSSLSGSGGGESTGCLLTLGVVIEAVPAAYLVNGATPILTKWCDAHRLHADVLEEIGRVRVQRAGSTTARMLDWCDRRLVELDRAEALAIEQVHGWEDDHRFGAALDWMALDLERRLQRVSAQEMDVWERRLGTGLSREAIDNTNGGKV